MTTSNDTTLRVELDGKMGKKDQELLLGWLRSRLDVDGASLIFDPATTTPTLVLSAPDEDALGRAHTQLLALAGESAT